MEPRIIRKRDEGTHVVVGSRNWPESWTQAAIIRRILTMAAVYEVACVQVALHVDLSATATWCGGVVVNICLKTFLLLPPFALCKRLVASHSATARAVQSLDT